MEISQAYKNHTAPYTAPAQADGATEASAQAKTAASVPAAGTQENANAAKDALINAGLKPTDENLKIVSLLIENKMPVNKENILQLSKSINFAGPENLKNAVTLIKNDIPATLASIEKFSKFVSGGENLLNQIKDLAKNIMSLDNGSEKLKLLRLFQGEVLNTLANSKSAVQNQTSPLNANKPVDVSGQQLRASDNTAMNVQTEAQKLITRPLNGLPESANLGDAANKGGVKTMAEGAKLALQPSTAETPLEQLKTGTSFFREVFRGTGDTAAQMSNIKLTTEERQLALDASSKIKGEFKALVSEGEITKEKILSLLSGTADSQKLANVFASDDKLKSFILLMAEQTGSLKDGVAKAKMANAEIEAGAKRIMDKLSLSVDEGDLDFKGLSENLKDKLSQIAKNIGEEHNAIKQNVEQIKDNMAFLSRFKNDTIVHFPIVINNQQTQAELYVFSDKKNKGKNVNKSSQSALLSLNLANLGLFETYLQKTGNTVTCQFRIKNEEIEQLVRSNIDKLQNGLKDKGLTLNTYNFRQTGEKFDAADGEPSINEEQNASINYSLDVRM